MMPGLTYAIPDIHGRADLLEVAIAKIASDAAGRGYTIVTLGDYVDRGPSSRAVVERLVQLKSEGVNAVHLKGNHEAMMVAVCNAQAELDWWTRNGGGETLRSYGEPQERPNLRNIPQQHLQWMAGLPVLHADQHRIFVHAAVDPEMPLNMQSEQVLLWRRYPKGFDRGHGPRYIVHGHDANPDGPFIGTGRANLDSMAWKTGRLTIGVFDNDYPGGPSDILEINN